MDSFFDDLIPRPRALEVRPGARVPPFALKLEPLNLSPQHARSIDRLANIVFRDRLKPSGRSNLILEITCDPALKGIRGPRIPKHLRSEAYELVLGERPTLKATQYAGIQRGLQTLRQLLENADQLGTLPHCRILDWPRIPHRGIHFDLAREMEYRPAFLQKVVERVAYFRMNTLHLYLENKFAYPSCPQVVPPDVMTPQQARQLCQYADLLGVTIIPQVPTLGHMEHFLHGELAGLREDPKSPFNLCPSHPQARPFLAGLIEDLAEAFGSPYIHLGYDESRSGVCPRCQRQGTASRILADHLNWLNQQVKSHGARTMIYGDKFLSPHQFLRSDAVNGGTVSQAHAALGQVDRDIVITDWHYTSPYGDTTRYLVDQGFEVHIASSTNLYWHDAVPLLRGQHWIADTTDRGIQAGASGAFNTNWEFYRGQFFDNAWYFQALAAERQWSGGKHDYQTYGKRFSSRFWGAQHDYYSDLMGLAETTPTQRTKKFLDDPVFADFPAQARFDYIELGDYITQLATRLRREAVRNRDTLRLLDMPGQIIRYEGMRAYQAAVVQRALQEGDKARLMGALKALLEAAQRIKSKVELGYKVYGAAVEDRKRIEAHKQSLARMMGRAAGLQSEALKQMTIPDLDSEERR